MNMFRVFSLEITYNVKEIPKQCLCLEMVLKQLQTKFIETVTPTSILYTWHPKDSSGAISGHTRIRAES